MSDDRTERVPRCSATTGKGTRCTKRALPGASRCAHHSWTIPGRPTKLTAELVTQIIDSVLKGAYLETAAQVAGIDKVTLYRWLRRADDVTARALEHAPPGDVDVYTLVDPAEWVYLDFRHALKAAEAYSEVMLLERVRGAGDGWQAFMTILERRHPARWGRRQVLDHTVKGEVEQRTKVELVVPADEERARGVAAILERAGALNGHAPASNGGER